MSLLITQADGLPLCVDTDLIPDEPSPVLDIALELALAGFKGIRFTEFKINAMRDGLIVEANFSTHEGKYMQRLPYLSPPPTPEEAVEAVKAAYAKGEPA